MSPPTSLLKKVARELQYRPLPEFVGQAVMIQSLETVEADSRHALGELWPKECVLIEKSVSPLAIAKYSILDLRFLVSTDYLAIDSQSGIPLLKELAFVVSPERKEEFKKFSETLGDKVADDPTCLRELSEDIAKGQTLLKLFLRSEAGVALYFAQDIPFQEKARHVEDPTLPPDYFPRDFVVTDACFTNADFVWFHKHFYF